MLWQSRYSIEEMELSMAQLEVVGISVDLGEERLAQLRERFPDITFDVECDLEKIAAAFTDIDLYIGRGRHIELLTNSPRLRWVQTLTAGADRVSFSDMKERGIIVTNGSGIHAENLSEHIMAFILSFARGFHLLRSFQARHEWVKDIPNFELTGQRLCIVGLGNIGLVLADRASRIGMRVTGVRRRDLPIPSYVESIATLETMNQLLPEADHVAICLPLTSRTAGLFDAEQLARMKPGAYIYNIGRGEIIDQDAMIQALRSGYLAGAGLDVTTPEPLPPDNPLWDMENVFITCHSGGTSTRRFDRFIDLLIDNIERYRSDRELLNIVDPVEGY